MILCTDIYISPQRTSAANDLQDLRSIFTLNLSFWPSPSAGRDLGPDLIVPRSSAFSIYQLARPRAVSTLLRLTAVMSAGSLAPMLHPSLEILGVWAAGWGYGQCWFLGRALACPVAFGTWALARVRDQ